MKIGRFFIGVLLVALSGACSQKKNTSACQITVSIPPQKTLVEEIGGDKVAVNCMMSSDANPESFEPAMNSLVTLQNSDIYFKMGTLDFERSLNGFVDEGSRLKVVDMSDGVEMLYGTHGDDCAHTHHGHGGHDADPHVWSSLKNMRIMASNVAEALSDADPDNREFYYSNLTRLQHRIDSLDSLVKNGLDSISTRSFIVWHPSLSYFARDYGLEQITVGSHGKEQSVKQLVERIDSAMTRNADVFFFQQEFDSRQASEINRQIGAEMIIINPMNPDWETEIMKVADALHRKK